MKNQEIAGDSRSLPCPDFSLKVDRLQVMRKKTVRELLQNLYHWKAYHPDIEDHVESYYAALDPAVVIDPMEPEESIHRFQAMDPPSHIYLTNRLHDRHCQRFIDVYRTTVWCHQAGLHEFEDGSLAVQPFKHGDTLPGGVQALEVGILCPEETAFHLPLGDGVLAIGDALVRWDGEIGFVPDSLLGEDPPAIKEGIRDAFFWICANFEFKHLLFAHGDPLLGNGKAALLKYLDTMKR